jgi:hypothetical protein
MARVPFIINDGPPKPDNSAQQDASRIALALLILHELQAHQLGTTG